MNKQCYTKLSALSLGLALAITWGIGILLLGLVATCCDWGSLVVTAIGSFYIGYTTTIFGSIIGFLWAFVDGFIGGALIALLYNLFTPKN